MTADGIQEHLWARPMARRHHLFPPRHKAIGLQKKVTKRSKHLFTASSMPEPCITYHITRISWCDYFHRLHIAEAEIQTEHLSAHPKGHRPLEPKESSLRICVPLATTLYSFLHFVGSKPQLSPSGQPTHPNPVTKTRSSHHTCGWPEKMNSWVANVKRDISE